MVGFWVEYLTILLKLKKLIKIKFEYIKMIKLNLSINQKQKNIKMQDDVMEELLQIVNVNKLI